MTATVPLYLRRTAAVGVLGLLLLAGWFGIAQPMAWLWTGDAEADQAAADRLARLTALAQRRPVFAEQVRSLQKALADPALLWSGSSPALISAAVQAQLRQVISAAGGSVRSTTELPVVPEHGLLRVSLRVDAEGTVETLQRTLHAVEAATPILIVDDLMVTAPDGGSTEAERPPVLSIRLDVTGYGRGA
jgi:general secretion pathway protein M